MTVYEREESYRTKDLMQGLFPNKFSSRKRGMFLDNKNTYIHTYTPTHTCMHAHMCTHIQSLSLASML